MLRFIFLFSEFIKDFLEDLAWRLPLRNYNVYYECLLFSITESLRSNVNEPQPKDTDIIEGIIRAFNVKRIHAWQIFHDAILKYPFIKGRFRETNAYTEYCTRNHH